MLDVVFPGAVFLSFRDQLNTLSPGFTMYQQLAPVRGSPYAKASSLDDFIQINIAEIRTTIHHLMQQPALATHCASDTTSRITTIREALLRDEVRRVAYIAVLKRRMRDAAPDRFADVVCRRFHDFDAVRERNSAIRRSTVRSRAAPSSHGIAPMVTPSDLHA